MNALLGEKLAQAAQLVRESGCDVWLTFVRETAEGGDPVLPLLIDGGLTWQSALLIEKSGRRVAVVGNYDAPPLIESDHWDQVIPYVQGIKEPLLEALESLCGPDPRIAVNFSSDDVKSDGLGHGLFMVLESYLKGTRFEDSLVSAESIAGPLRARKSPMELALIRDAIADTKLLLDEIGDFARVGLSEVDVYEFAQSKIDYRKLGYAWDRSGNPIVNSGPDSMIGHGRPSSAIRIAPGHIFHVDIGVIHGGYSSDIQRIWYVGEEFPDDVARAFDAVHGAITVGASKLKPGVLGWQVDEAARKHLCSKGYPEYLHALGHQVGRMAHDGGAILGPKWDRYGKTPSIPVCAGEVYTLELGTMVPGRGYLGLEEMVVVTDVGCEFITERQDRVMRLR